MQQRLKLRSDGRPSFVDQSLCSLESQNLCVQKCKDDYVYKVCAVLYSKPEMLKCKESCCESPWSVDAHETNGVTIPAALRFAREALLACATSIHAAGSIEQCLKEEV